MIKKAKLSYYNDQIAENKNNPQKLWKTLKQLGHSRLKTKTTNLNMKINGSLITDKLNVANCLNNFFTTIATTLVNKLPSHSGLYGEQHIQAFYKNKGVRKDDFKFMEVTTEDALKKTHCNQPRPQAMIIFPPGSSETQLSLLPQWLPTSPTCPSVSVTSHKNSSSRE